jgi:hypothetical protein
LRGHVSGHPLRELGRDVCARADAYIVLATSPIKRAQPRSAGVSAANDKIRRDEQALRAVSPGKKLVDFGLSWESVCDHGRDGKILF